MPNLDILKEKLANLLNVNVEDLDVYEDYIQCIDGRKFVYDEDLDKFTEIRKKEEINRDEPELVREREFDNYEEVEEVEEEIVEEEEVPDEYYEDLFEQELEEVEAAVEAQKEKEKAEAEKKAKAKEKKKKEEARAKAEQERQAQLEAERKKAAETLENQIHETGEEYKTENLTPAEVLVAVGDDVKVPSSETKTIEYKPEEFTDKNVEFKDKTPADSVEWVDEFSEKKGAFGDSDIKEYKAPEYNDSGDLGYTESEYKESKGTEFKDTEYPDPFKEDSGAPKYEDPVEIADGGFVAQDFYEKEKKQGYDDPSYNESGKLPEQGTDYNKLDSKDEASSQISTNENADSYGDKSFKEKYESSEKTDFSSDFDNVDGYTAPKYKTVGVEQPTDPDYKPEEFKTESSSEFKGTEDKNIGSQFENKNVEFEDSNTEFKDSVGSKFGEYTFQKNYTDPAIDENGRLPNSTLAFDYKGMSPEEYSEAVKRNPELADTFASKIEPKVEKFDETIEFEPARKTPVYKDGENYVGETTKWPDEFKATETKVPESKEESKFDTVIHGQKERDFSDKREISVETEKTKIVYNPEDITISKPEVEVGDIVDGSNGFEKGDDNKWPDSFKGAEEFKTETSKFDDPEYEMARKAPVHKPGEEYAGESAKLENTYKAPEVKDDPKPEQSTTVVHGQKRDNGPGVDKSEIFDTESKTFAATVPAMVAAKMAENSNLSYEEAVNDSLADIVSERNSVQSSYNQKSKELADLTAKESTPENIARINTLESELKEYKTRLEDLTSERTKIEDFMKKDVPISEVETGSHRRPEYKSQTVENVQTTSQTGTTGGRVEDIVKYKDSSHFDAAGIPILVSAKMAGNSKLGLEDAANDAIADIISQRNGIQSKIYNTTKELVELKNNGGSAEKISALENQLKTDRNKLSELAKDKSRIEQFMKDGPAQKGAGRNDDLADKIKKSNIEIDSGKGAPNPKGNFEFNSKNVLNSAANMAVIQKARVSKIVGDYSKRFAMGVKGAFKRLVDEDEDLRKEDEIIDEADNIRRVLGKHFSHRLEKVEMNKLGLGKKAINQEIKEIVAGGVIVGVGDVSKMSIEELTKALEDKGLNEVARKNIERLIELKKRLDMKVSDIAERAMKEAGEYITYSRRKLEKLLKDATLDPTTRKQIEEALKYKTLWKRHQGAKGKWKSIGSLFTGWIRKLLSEDEYIGQMINLGGHAMTVYRIGKTGYRAGRFVVNKIRGQGANKAATDAVKAAAKKTPKGMKAPNKGINGLKKGRDIKQAASAAKEAAKTGARAKNLVGAGKNAGKVAGEAVKGVKKGAEWAARAMKQAAQAIQKTIQLAKEAVIALGKAIAAAVEAIAAAIAGGGWVVIVVVIVILLAFLLGASIYTMVLGDESNDTDVVKLVEYLEEKNANLVQEIENKANGSTGIADRRGRIMPKYTDVYYTYYDRDGSLCMITNNTKEIISMAAVYFEQDFSDKDAVYEYLDKMWEVSHNVTYTSSGLYGCTDSKMICLKNGSMDPDTTRRGFNAISRSYSCAGEYTAPIVNLWYNDCYKLSAWYDDRIATMEESYRFTNYASRYSGIYPYYQVGSKGGYGCIEKRGKYYCTNINNESPEIQRRLVDATGIPFSTLSENEGCIKKHSFREGKPSSSCYNYDYYRVYHRALSASCGLDTSTTYTFDWNSGTARYECEVDGVLYSFDGEGNNHSSGRYSNLYSIDVKYRSDKGEFGYYVYYYTCLEGDCPGHNNLLYHECDAHHEEYVCLGHADLTVNLEVLSFDKIFELEVDLPDIPGQTSEINANTCSHTNRTITNDENGVMVSYVCNDCQVIYTVGSGYDYSNCPVKPGGEASINDNIWDEDDIEWAKTIYEQDWKEMYGIEIPSSLYGFGDMGTIIMPTHPSALPIPLFNQNEYSEPYGNYGTVASHGCGITCVAMLDSYYKDTTTSPAFLAKVFGNYNTSVGSLWSLFPDTASKLEIPYQGQTYSWTEVVKALQNGQPVVSIQNENGVFTSGGHFILLTGITVDGRILVNDPNGNNYRKPALQDGYANGFSQQIIQQGSSGSYWIYGVKPGASILTPTPANP